MKAAVVESTRTAARLAIGRATWGSNQNFLGARWVAALVDKTPERMRERAALRVLSLSPHYFYARDLQAEAERNRASRRALVDGLIAPYLGPDIRVIDYGCGPGYMAREVAERVGHVDAVDISPGVLACASLGLSRRSARA
jgi:SAM-dependent methyltransferase